MSITKLVEFEDESGDYTAVWHDEVEDVIIVQYNFVHLTLAPTEFTAFSQSLSQAVESFKELPEGD